MLLCYDIEIDVKNKISEVSLEFGHLTKTRTYVLTDSISTKSSLTIFCMKGSTFALKLVCEISVVVITPN